MSADEGSEAVRQARYEQELLAQRHAVLQQSLEESTEIAEHQQRTIGLLEARLKEAQRLAEARAEEARMASQLHEELEQTQQQLQQSQHRLKRKDSELNQVRDTLEEKDRLIEESFQAAQEQAATAAAANERLAALDDDARGIDSFGRNGDRDRDDAAADVQPLLISEQQREIQRLRDHLDEEREHAKHLKAMLKTHQKGSLVDDAREAQESVRSLADELAVLQMGPPAPGPAPVAEPQQQQEDKAEAAAAAAAAAAASAEAAELARQRQQQLEAAAAMSAEERAAAEAKAAAALRAAEKAAAERTLAVEEAAAARAEAQREIAAAQARIEATRAELEQRLQAAEGEKLQELVRRRELEASMVDAQIRAAADRKARQEAERETQQALDRIQAERAALESEALSLADKVAEENARREREAAEAADRALALRLQSEFEQEQLLASNADRDLAFKLHSQDSAGKQPARGAAPDMTIPEEQRESLEELFRLFPGVDQPTIAALFAANGYDTDLTARDASHALDTAARKSPATPTPTTPAVAGGAAASAKRHLSPFDCEQPPPYEEPSAFPVSPQTPLSVDTKKPRAMSSAARRKEELLRKKREAAARQASSAADSKLARERQQELLAARADALRREQRQREQELHRMQTLQRQQDLMRLHRKQPRPPAPQQVETQPRETHEPRDRLRRMSSGSDFGASLPSQEFAFQVMAIDSEEMRDLGVSKGQNACILKISRDYVTLISEHKFDPVIEWPLQRIKEVGHHGVHVFVKGYLPNYDQARELVFGAAKGAEIVRTLRKTINDYTSRLDTHVARGLQKTEMGRALDLPDDFMHELRINEEFNKILARETNTGFDELTKADDTFFKKKLSEMGKDSKRALRSARKGTKSLGRKISGKRFTSPKSAPLAFQNSSGAWGAPPSPSFSSAASAASPPSPRSTGRAFPPSPGSVSRRGPPPPYGGSPGSTRRARAAWS